MQYIKLLRPEQWVKNLFVFVPAFFSGSIGDSDRLLPALMAFVAFSLAASAVYCLNDIIDADDDRRHPLKRLRPVASGAVSVGRAYALMAAALVLSALALWTMPAGRAGVAAVVGSYFALNVAYCLWLKHHSIVDVCVIAVGFVLRLAAGGLASGVYLSHWVVLMTFLVTLFLALAKRRDDVLRMNKTGKAPRKNTSRYNLTFMNQAITVTASVTVVCYIMYTVSPDVAGRFGTKYLYLTSVFVVVGLLRYIQITFVDEKSGDPTAIALHDRFIQVVLACWCLSFFAIIYLS